MNRAEILVIGGGVIGLAIATELRLQGAQVTLLSRDFQAAAGQAAAGMLAPRAEGLAPGPMLELCLRSLALYPDWVSKIEAVSGQTTGYWPCGILAPVLTLTAGQAPSESQAAQVPLSGTAIHHYQPGLNPAVKGGWFYPEEGQVDSRALLQALRTAAQELGVDIQEGVAVEALIQRQQKIASLRTSAGEFQAEHYVLATGAWSSQLLPLPVFPCKGQMLALRTPDASAQLTLHRVLFGEEIYIVPRQDGRIVLGATTEDVGFSPHNTAAGIAQLLNAAIRLYPPLQAYPLQECWWGYRPTTPDQLPILGPGPCTNLTLATGHHRNGILLAPITAKLITQSIQHQPDPLLQPFSYDRFHSSDPSTPDPTTFLGRQGNPAPTLHPTPPATLSLPHSPTPPLPMQLLTSPHPTPHPPTPLTIAGRTFQSRLMTGSGKFDSFETMRQSLAASGSEIVTVAVRRVQTNAPGHEGLAAALDWQKLWMLPNTAGCQTADEAIRVARLGREMAKLLGQEDNNFVKLEVIPDPKYLLPDPIDTLKAAEQLVKEGFAVLPYINADPVLAKRLEEVGCATVMPLGSPIGSGQGIRNAASIQIIVENAQIPVVVDAGIGTPSEAAYSMELGADALLINTAIAKATDPVAMGRAMGLATEAGRLAYLAGRIPVKTHASASSPTTGQVSH